LFFLNSVYESLTIRRKCSASLCSASLWFVTWNFVFEIYRHTTRSIAGIKYNGRNLRRDTRSRKRRVVTSQVLAAAAVRRRPGPAADCGRATAEMSVGCGWAIIVEPIKRSALIGLVKDGVVDNVEKWTWCYGDSWDALTVTYGVELFASKQFAARQCCYHCFCCWWWHLLLSCLPTRSPAFVGRDATRHRWTIHRVTVTQFSSSWFLPPSCG